MENVTWQSVESSAIAAAGWDAETRTSWLRFKDGSMAHYPGMAWTQFRALVNAPSVGKHYNLKWRGKEGQRVGK